MSTEFHSYTREEFITEFVHPDDRQAVEEARERRVAQVRGGFLADMRNKVGLTQAEVAQAMGCPSSASRRSRTGPSPN